MALSILNNIPSLVAQNQLAITNTNLKNTLFQLSSGSKINSGADDPAGLSISNGLQANISALTQSAQNVSNGVGMLQTADGALSQVTTLLNRAVTLATEAANTGLTTSQISALQNEFTSITAEINQIGSNTTYNNNAVFSGSAMSVFLSDGSAADAADPNITVAMPTLSASALGLASYATGTIDLTGVPTAGNTVTIGSQTYTFEATASAANQVALGSDVQTTLQNLQSAVNGTGSAGIGTYGVGTAANNSASITSVNGGSAVVQSLTAGTGGNQVVLATSLTSNVGGGGGTTLSNGVDATNNVGTLTLSTQPGILSTAMGSITMTALPDTISNASGVLNLTAANPTASVNAHGTLNLTAANPTGGNSTGTFTLTNVQAGDTVTLGTGANAQTYTFVANASAFDGNANEVAIYGTLWDAATNLQKAIEGTGTAGVDYSAGTVSGAATGAVITSSTPVLGQFTFASTAINQASTVNLAYNNAGGGTGNVSGLTAGHLTYTGTGSDTVTLGGTTYTFVAAGAATAGNEVALGANQHATLQNLQAALAGGAGSAATFHVTGGAANNAAVMNITSNSTTVTATTAGNGGNNVAFSATGSIAGDVSTTGLSGYLGGSNAGDTVTIGSMVYTFVAAGQAATGANQISIGANQNAALQNLQLALAGGAGSAATFHTVGNAANNIVTMSISGGGTGNIATLTASTAGVGGGATGNNTAFSATGSLGGDVTAMGGGVNGDTITIGGQTYSFVAQNEALQANYVAIGGTSASVTASEIDTTLVNLMDAVNGTGGTAGANTFGTGTSAAGTASMYVAAGGTATSATITAAAPGTAGNGVVALSATGTISTDVGPTGFLGGGMNADTLTLGGTTYTFVAAGQALAADQVAIVTSGSLAANIQSTLTNLLNAVNGTGTASNTTYGTGTTANTTATVSGVSSGVVSVEAGTAGVATPGLGNGTTTGNAVALSASSSTGTLTVSGASLTGGANPDTVTVGAVTYTFVAAGQATTGNEVAQGDTMQHTLDNLKAAVNSTAIANGSAATYHLLNASMLQGANGATITTDTGGVATVQAANAGVLTNGIALSAAFGSGSATGALGGLTYPTTLAEGTASAAATGTINLFSNAANGNTVTVGNLTYTFVTSGSATAGNTVAIGVNANATLANLANAVNNTSSQSGTTYHLLSATVNPAATITAVNGNTAVVTASAVGVGGNATALTAVLANGMAGIGDLSGGAAASAATGNFVLTGNPSDQNTVTIGTQTYTFTTAAPTAANQVMLGGTITDTLNNLMAAVNNGPAGTGAGTTYGTGTVANTEATISSVVGNQAVITANSSNLGTGGDTIVLSANLSSGTGGGTVGTIGSKLSGGGASVDLNSPVDAQTALTTIAGAISTVAGQRGAIGSGINQMNAALSVMTNTSQNLTSSLSGIQDADIGKVVANMSKYQVLEQTGISALAQSNSQAQAVLKLLQ